MTLVFGGAYMGKQDYAKAHLGAGEIEQCGERPAVVPDGLRGGAGTV